MCFLNIFPILRQNAANSEIVIVSMGNLFTDLSYFAQPRMSIGFCPRLTISNAILPC